MVDPFQIIDNPAQPIEAATPTSSPLPIPCSDLTTALKQEEEEERRSL
ncbi:MAG TPA: hypothetical protein VE643_06140 [Nitrososphaeraceae archaeon]|nr:hypothetical protein [Nitrososphaeraceae archaeon]